MTMQYMIIKCTVVADWYQIGIGRRNKEQLLDRKNIVLYNEIRKGSKLIMAENTMQMDIEMLFLHALEKVFIVQF